MRRLNARIFSTASLAAIAVGFPAVAYAQVDPVAPVPTTTVTCEDIADAAARADCLADLAETQPETQEGGQSIQVTGTRIRRPNLESNVPITSVGIEELTDTGDVSLGDQLNDLPSLRSTFSTGNSGRFIGTAGLSLLDLRGLGTARTLVLVNNRRHVTGSVGSRDVDVNTIPIDLVERVDIVTGGNSAIYGSDAIAGVVNFVLRRDFDGIRARGQMGISERGDANRHFVSLTAGRNFAADRGNIAIALEYAKQDPLYFVDRNEITGAYSGRCQYNLAEITTDDGADNDDGIPDNERFCGVRNANVYDSGQITTVGSCATLTGAAFAARCLPSGLPRLFYFDPQGNLVEDPIIGTDFRQFGSGNSTTANGSSLRNTGQLAAGVERYNANLLAHFDVTEAFRPFFEAKFARVNTIQEGQPSFATGFLSSFFGGNLSDNLRCDNAFITPQARAQLQAIGRCIVDAAGNPVPRAGVNIFDFAGDNTGPIEILPINRFNVDFGGRGEIGERDTYRIVAGFEGDFNEDWHYEVSLNYGRVRTRLQSLNNLLTREFLDATNAAVGPGGTPVCRINVDADPNNNDPNCVPLNLFGLGAPSPAALNYVNITSTRRQRASQLQGLAFVSGDSSQLFELPGGPVGFALGVEYRRDTAFSKWSPEVEAGDTFLNAIQEFNPPADEVYEAFGEIRLPILRDLPFAQELTIEAAGRVSHYEAGSTGTVYAYNVGGTWAPVRDIRFRANYSTSVRAPTLGDLFSPQSQNFAFIADPCDILNRNNPTRPNRDANCTAAGIPPGFVNTPARTSSTSFLQGGNEFLTEEEGKSLTIGAVVQPRWVPGLSITVDYYDISIDALIATLTAQTIINQCYDDPNGINNAFCAIVFRNPDGTFAQPTATIAGPVNFARFDARGIDFEVSYRRTFGNGHRLNLRGVATRVLENTAYLDPTDPTFGNRFRSEIGDPSWAANLNVNYTFDRYEFTYNLNYVGRQINAGLAYETLFPFQDRPATNPDSIPANERWTPDVFYHNIRLGFRVNEDFTFYGGVDNIGDRLPPFGQLGTAGGEPWETFGRRFYFGVNVNFR